MPKLEINGKEIAELAFRNSGIKADPMEITSFYNKYVKTIQLSVDEDGNFDFKIKPTKNNLKGSE